VPSACLTELRLHDLQFNILVAKGVTPSLADVAGTDANGGAMVQCGPDEFGEEEVGPVADRYVDGLGHADSGIQDDETVSGRRQHPPERGRGVGELTGEASGAAGVRDRSRQSELEAGGGGDWSGRAKIEPLTSEGQECEVVIDDDHSGGLEVRVGPAEPARPISDVASGREQRGIEVGVLGEIELSVYERSYNVTAG